MKAMLETVHLKRLIKSTAKCISKEDRKLMLQYIRLEFDKESMLVTASALDGYKLSIETAPCRDIDESFTAYIRPHLPVGAQGKASNIELTGDNCLIEIDGRITGYKQPKGEFIDTHKIIKDYTTADTIQTICFTKEYLVDTLNSIQFGKNERPIIEIEIRGEIMPVIIKSKNGTRLISPCRKS